MKNQFPPITVHAKYNTIQCSLIYWAPFDEPLTCVWWWLLVLHRIDANHRDAALWWLPFWGLAGLNWIDISCPCGTHWFWRPFIYTPLKYRDIGLILHELRVLETLLSYIMVIGGNFTHILFPSKVYIIFKGTSIYLHLCHSKFCNIPSLELWYRLHLDTDLNNFA